jgi:hypothetical protein
MWEEILFSGGEAFSNVTSLYIILVFFYICPPNPYIIIDNMSSKADYLAKYLTADPPAKKSKKRKRVAGQEEALIIADDDISGWNNAPRDRKERSRDDGLVVTSRSGQSTSRRKANSHRSFGRFPQEKVLCLDNCHGDRAGKRC